MALTGRPLLDTLADAPLFVDRDIALTQVVTAVRRGWNVLVVGERGSGKTSLVRQVIYRTGRAHEGEIDYVFVRGTGAVTPAELLGRVCDAIEGKEARPGERTQVNVEANLDELREMVQAWAEQGSQPVVVLDDPPPAIGNGVFGPLRDELWALGVPWLVTVPTSGVHQLTTPPADAFFEARVTLEGLDDTSAAQLLRTRLGGDLSDATPVGEDSVVAQAVAIAGGNPRRLLEVARAVMAAPAPEGSPEAGVLAIGYRARDEALATLGRSAHMLYAELEAMGPVSASDAALLRRMGWTRPRAVQVLGQLEAAGLVTSQPVRGPEGGRPRQEYAVVPAVDFVPSMGGST